MQIIVPTTAEEIRDQWIQDYASLMFSQGVVNPAIGQGSEPYIRATAIANIALLLFTQIQLAAQDTSELYAEGDALENIRIAMGLEEVIAQGSVGKITVSIPGGQSVTFLDGLDIQYPNGLRGKVNGTQAGVTNGKSINIKSIDTGTDTNLAPGTEVKFANPPAYVSATAIVGANGLSGGTNEETDAEKRTRILEKRRNVPAGGNWSYVRDLALKNPIVQECFVYPALGGPGSCKVIVTKDINKDFQDYTRDIVDGIDDVKNSIFSAMPVPYEIIVDTVNNYPIDISIQLSLTNNKQFKGWESNTTIQFPKLKSSSPIPIAVTSIVDSKNFVILANTSDNGTPVIGQSRIQWIEKNTKKVIKATIMAYSVIDGTHMQITVDYPMVIAGISLAVGDLIGPAITNAQNYVNTWCDIMNTLGPSENTTNNYILPRAKRRPFVDDTYPSSLTAKQESDLENAYVNEIISAELFSTTTEPPVPADINTNPYILTTNKLAFYKAI